MASANAGFAFKLLKEISKELPNRNVFISPYSASTVLRMVCNGARGQTLSVMQRVLGTAGLAAEIVNSATRHQASLTRRNQASETRSRGLKPHGYRQIIATR